MRRTRNEYTPLASLAILACMIAIVDYRMGNLRSVQKALAQLGHDAQIVRTPDEIDAATRLILPGVGAFGDAMAHLAEQELIEPIRAYAASGKPFLGICLGLQLLFESSCEGEMTDGLGILPGRVVHFEPADPSLKVPHMGWNALRFEQADNPLFVGLEDGCFCYFVHAYYAEPTEPADTAATAEYDGPFCASVHRDNVWATQFHPEKSQRVGLRMLQNFAAL